MISGIGHCLSLSVEATTAAVTSIKMGRVPKIRVSGFGSAVEKYFGSFSDSRYPKVRFWVPPNPSLTLYGGKSVSDNLFLAPKDEEKHSTLLPSFHNAQG